MDTPGSVLEKWDWNWFCMSSQVKIELGRRLTYQVKAWPVNELGKSLNFRAIHLFDQVVGQVFLSLAQQAVGFVLRVIRFLSKSDLWPAFEATLWISPTKAWLVSLCLATMGSRVTITSLATCLAIGATVPTLLTVPKYGFTVTPPPIFVQFLVYIYRSFLESVYRSTHLRPDSGDFQCLRGPNPLLETMKEALRHRQR
ncbi:hypothetical protein HAX54_014457 [Datura stramonium]|uniref:Uncharacterized protein n=1 Tax=Datura stramonium TaxID=4076 RepID=A0ABS8RIS7_DATST|nr:hypothetical protein [Datura stramonium]